MPCLASLLFVRVLCIYGACRHGIGRPNPWRASVTEGAVLIVRCTLGYNSRCVRRQRSLPLVRTTGRLRWHRVRELASSTCTRAWFGRGSIQLLRFAFPRPLFDGVVGRQLVSGSILRNKVSSYRHQGAISSVLAGESVIRN